jgi:small-conductance mechanosensitive channel
MTTFFTLAQKVMSMPLVTLGKTTICLWTLLYLAALSYVLIWSSAKLKQFLLDKVLSKTQLDEAVRNNIAVFARGTMLTVGTIAILQTAGIDLSALTILAGALGLGISYGLKIITTNLASGLILLLERPIKIGDRIKIGDVEGVVENISIRSITVRTDDSTAIIVPNSDVISKNIVNLSYIQDDLTLLVGVCVDPQADADIVQEEILNGCFACDFVSKDQNVILSFEELTDKHLKFVVKTATNGPTTELAEQKRKLAYAIFKQLKAKEIKLVGIK